MSRERELQEILRKLQAAESALTQSKKVVDQSLDPIQKSYKLVTDSIVQRNKEFSKILTKGFSKIGDEYKDQLEDILGELQSPGADNAKKQRDKLKALKKIINTKRGILDDKEEEYLDSTIKDLEEEVSKRYGIKAFTKKKINSIFSLKTVGTIFDKVGAGGSLSTFGDYISKIVDRREETRKEIAEQATKLEKLYDDRVQDLSKEFERVSKQEVETEKKEKEESKKRSRMPWNKGKTGYKKSKKSKGSLELPMSTSDAPVVFTGADEKVYTKLVDVNQEQLKELKRISKSQDDLVEYKEDEARAQLEKDRESQIKGNSTVNPKSLFSKKGLAGLGVAGGLTGAAGGKDSLLTDLLQGAAGGAILSSVPSLLKKAPGLLGKGLGLAAIASQGIRLGTSVVNNKEHAEEYGTNRFSAGAADVLHSLALGIPELMGMNSKDTANSIGNIGDTIGNAASSAYSTTKDVASTAYDATKSFTVNSAKKVGNFLTSPEFKSAFFKSLSFTPIGIGIAGINDAAEGITDGIQKAKELLTKARAEDKPTRDLERDVLRKSGKFLDEANRKKTIILSKYKDFTPEQAKTEQRKKDVRITALERRRESLTKRGRNTASINRQIEKLKIESEGLGAISKHFESGNMGTGAISSGVGDPGGKSYGEHQLSSNAGTLSKYLQSNPEYGKQFEGLAIGSPEFDAKWKELAAKDPNFGKSQKDFITDTHYKPLLEGLAQDGKDLSKRSRAVQEALYSTSVQYGSARSLVNSAIGDRDPNTMSDEELINAIQDRKLQYQSGPSLSGRIQEEREKLLELSKDKTRPEWTTAEDKTRGNNLLSKSEKSTMLKPIVIPIVQPQAPAPNYTPKDGAQTPSVAQTRNPDPVFQSLVGSSYNYSSS